MLGPLKQLLARHFGVTSAAGVTTISNPLVLTSTAEFKNTAEFEKAISTDGELSVGDDLSVGADLTVGDNKFTVAAATGNTVVDGALSAGTVSTSAVNADVVSSKSSLQILDSEGEVAGEIKVDSTNGIEFYLGETLVASIGADGTYTDQVS
jgi:hypothetical protein